MDSVKTSKEGLTTAFSKFLFLLLLVQLPLRMARERGVNTTEAVS